MTTFRSVPLLLVLAVGACDGGEKTDAKAVAPKKAGDANARVYDGPGGDDGGGGPAINPQQILDRVKPIMAALPKEAPNPDNPITEAKVELGRILYFEKRLSKNHDLSCATCHDLANYGIDMRERDGKRTATSPGHRGQLGERNTPTVYNAALHFVQFWDGRAKDVEEQAKGPVLNPVEMAMPNEAAVVAVLRSIPGYEEKFTAAFPDDDPPITYENMSKAIGAFERTLLVPARYDDFLGGDLDALDGKQLRGLQLFLDVGCTQCHSGALLGGAQFQKLGTIKPWPDLHDEGRAKITASEADKFVFKVPSLRNVTKTAPYLHNGSEAELGNVVRLMAEHQTAKGKLQDEELEAILAFLGSLTGELPRDRIAEPTLPESGPKTPGPDPT
jgi:cytochrome c peroxidase